MIKDGIKAVIFDYGGVIINIDYQATIEAFNALGTIDFEEMYSQASQSNLFNQIETGKISGQYFINQLLDYLPSGASPNKVVAAWNAMIKDVPKDRIELLFRLKREGYRLILLSNTNEIHIKLADQRWNSVHHESPKEVFDSVYYSHEVNMRKPNKEIFEFVCQEQQLNPEDFLFIDDSIQHIEGAKSIGINAILLEKDKSIHDIFS
ncbi:MAG: HAD family phosphatase [Flavobacteriales bacterium]|nr:HAD family phosphatase [Flavobacteriales bacterium]